MIGVSERLQCDVRGFCDIDVAPYSRHHRTGNGYTAFLVSDITGVLVTGGAGFVGATLVRRLVAHAPGRL